MLKLVLTQKRLNLHLHTEPIKLCMESTRISEGSSYFGPYQVTPKAFKSSVLNTKNKLLNKDIQVKEIPYFETDNQFGNTIYIGNEVEIND